MSDERNDLIRVGDALDAITDWLCEEELRHNIEPNRRVNKFFASVMLENVPRAERKTEPNCEECKHFNEQSLTYMKQCKYYFMECRFEPKDEPQTETSTNAEKVQLTDEPQTDCVKVGKWYSFTDYVVEMQGDNKPKEFRVVPQTDCSWR